MCFLLSQLNKYTKTPANLCDQNKVLTFPLNMVPSYGRIYTYMYTYMFSVTTKLNSGSGVVNFIMNVYMRPAVPLISFLFTIKNEINMKYSHSQK